MKFFKKSDLIIIVILMSVGLASYILSGIISKDKAAVAEIYYYSELIETVYLDGQKENIFSIEQNPNVRFKIDESGGIAFIESDCPDKVCIKAGRLSRVGEYAACLPNGIVIKVVTEKDRDKEEADIIIRN